MTEAEDPCFELSRATGYAMLKFSLGSILVFLTCFAPLCELNIRKRDTVIHILGGPSQTIRKQGFPATYRASWFFIRPDGSLNPTNAKTKYFAGPILLNLAVAATCSLSAAVVYEWLFLKVYPVYREFRGESRMLDRLLDPETQRRKFESYQASKKQPYS